MPFSIDSQTMTRFEDHETQELFPLKEEVDGPVVEWLARDARDHVAVFIAIPAADFSPQVLDHLDEHRRGVAAILGAPVTTQSVFGASMGNERGDRWRALVERGLFVFAAYRSDGPYWIAEAPLQPLHVLDLPPVASELLARLPRLGLPFRHVASVMPDSLGIDLSGSNRGRLS